MSQHLVKVNVANGSPSVVIVGEDARSWIRQDIIFFRSGTWTPYFLTNSAVYSGGNTTVTLTGNYAAPTEANVDGVFAVDATYPLQIPIINQGDVGTAAIFTASMYRIQGLLALTDPANIATIEGYKNAAQQAANQAVVAVQQVADTSANAAASAASATAAATSASQAAGSAGNALSSANAATAAKDNANTSATAAATSATSASNSAAAASASATNATNNASNAATSATTATNRATAATASASNAATSETNAHNSQLAAAASATSAGLSATSSATTATAAAASASAAQASASSANAAITQAQNWATAPVNTVVANGQYSAFHWAQQAQNSATGQLVYRGSWNAGTGSYPAGPHLGDYYKISVAGTISSVAYAVNDSIIYNGVGWDKIDSTDAVTSVAGRVGAVTLTSADVSGVLSTSNNLSDLSSASTARINLGLGSMATQAANNILVTGGNLDGVTINNMPIPLALASGGTGGASRQEAINVLTNAAGVASGTIFWRNSSGNGMFVDANTAGLMKGANNLSEITDANAARASLGLGTAATVNSSTLLLKANNLSDLTSAGTARSNLGLGSAAVLSSSAVFQVSNALSELGVAASTARTNLGLGSAATQASSAFATAAQGATADAALARAGGTMTGSVNFNNKDLIGLKTIGFQQQYDNGNLGTAITINWANGQFQFGTLNANCTVTVPAPPSPGKWQLRFRQDATGGRAITWAGSVQSFRWEGSSSAPAIYSAPFGDTIVEFYYDGGATSTPFSQRLALIGSATP